MFKTKTYSVILKSNQGVLIKGQCWRLFHWPGLLPLVDRLISRQDNLLGPCRSENGLAHSSRFTQHVHEKQLHCQWVSSKETCMRKIGTLSSADKFANSPDNTKKICHSGFLQAFANPLPKRSTNGPQTWCNRTHDFLRCVSGSHKRCWWRWSCVSWDKWLGGFLPEMKPCLYSTPRHPWRLSGRAHLVFTGTENASWAVKSHRQRIKIYTSGVCYFVKMFYICWMSSFSFLSFQLQVGPAFFEHD